MSFANSVYARVIRRYPKAASLLASRTQLEVLSATSSEITIRDVEKDWKLVLDRKHGLDLLGECLAYRRYYLPSFPLEGKTVLDIGAGGGETAYVFLKAGAKEIVSVEADPYVERYLRGNAERNGWNIRVFIEPFALNHLKIPHD